MRRPWQVLDGARFERGDPLWRKWDGGEGMYGSNGAAMAIIERSSIAGAEPDTLFMALLARFEGYRDGFSDDIRRHRDYLTWAVLKAHTRNRAGTVTLRSPDPRDTPLVNFRYFEEGDDLRGDDLRACVEAIRSVRRLTAPLIAKGLIAEECAPGPQADSDEALAQFVRDTAWGHHASCTCPIGPAEAGGVLDSRFAVHGVGRLRVVDASVFPTIPGFFISSAVYIAAEKAADAILH
jgi:choline dehydrogenase-like flavoprotein